MAVAFILFFGGNASTPIERRLDAVRLAIAVHLLRAASKAQFDPLLVVSPDPTVHDALARYAEVLRPSTTPFHLGHELQRIARDRRLDRLCVTGAGYGALVSAADLRALRERVDGADEVLISNNYYSGDLVAFAPAKALDALDLPATDNPLPRLLHQQAGLPNHELPRGAAWLLDVDTPTDATILARDMRCPPEVRAAGTWEREIGPHIDRIAGLFVTPDVEVVVAGRVGAPVWSFLETQTACRVRMLSEERGMQAAGRDAAGAARTVLGFLYEQLGPDRFFARMAELGQGLILDSRVLFAHLGLRPSAADRFASDVFDAGAIAEPKLRAFTEAASAAPIPVLLGGHSVVSGALFTLAELAWQRPVASSPTASRQ
ncbi:MAG: hypothetical protein AUH85_16280 [Chloroflexi bacterium 13_1_40CM_4_68_4]|nr:MAG: hypothetical protein AUH85_16280 [Chloroflexi bacterium 13_1_40CM_4_68_4]